MNSKQIDFLMRMKHSPVRNYAIPGLTSYLIGEPSKQGTVRLFECSRDHQEPITPHSHRFDFTCEVLQGGVTNRVWLEQDGGDDYAIKKLKYSGEIGQYKEEHVTVRQYVCEDTFYKAGDVYEMQSDQIHSIYFSKGSVVLFMEGATKTNESLVLEPFVDGAVVPTFKTEPWMFLKEVK